MHRLAAAALAVLVSLAIIGQIWLDAEYGGTSTNDMSLVEEVSLMAAFGMYLVVGLVLLLRRPDHRLGWVLTGIGVLTSVGVFAESYATAALVTAPHAGLPAAGLAAWFYNVYWYPLLGLVLLFVPMLYPTGRPLTPRWRWLFRAAVAVLFLITLTAAVSPRLPVGAIEDPDAVVVNPIGAQWAGDIEHSPLGDALFVTLFILAAAAVVSLVLRFWRSRGTERQQMKLFVLAGFLLVGIPLIEETGVLPFLPRTDVLFAIAIAMPPIAIGVAVLRYRLYEIDRVISRTVSYVVLSAVLLALYLGAVTALTAVTAPVTRESPIAVAAATLLAAAAFGPARRRIQAVVDRRFNRRRYDAARAVDAYRATLRDEVDLGSVRSQLLAAVEETVQPATVAMWLRDGTTEVAR